jgi:hypothetical protein
MLDYDLPLPDHMLQFLWTLMGKATNERTVCFFFVGA